MSTKSAPNVFRHVFDAPENMMPSPSDSGTVDRMFLRLDHELTARLIHQRATQSASYGGNAPQGRKP